MKTITIACVDHPRTVEVYMHGKFAVHMSNFEPLATGGVDSCYTISHIATGRMVATKCGRPEARRLAKALDQALTNIIGADLKESDVAGKSATWRKYISIAKGLIEEARAVS